MKAWFVLFLLLSTLRGISQNLNGQWHGTFNSANNIVAGEGDTEYILELSIDGEKVSGYSYSYFNDPGKRYYVICRLDGSYDAASKSIIVNEEEKVRSNTPSYMSDCLQTHILTYLKQGGTEKLVGRWRGYRPNGCGVGSTELERKTLTRVTPPAAARRHHPPVAKNTPQQTKPAPKTSQGITSLRPPSQKQPSGAKSQTPKTDTPQQGITSKPQKIAGAGKTTLPEVTAPAIPGYMKRSKNILKVIDIPADEEIKVDFYDNGEIDGDTISVFFNDKLLLSKQGLTDKPLTLKIEYDTTREENELVMYADNLGTIPPNTALMIVTVNGKRHEVYITSTEKSSGTVRFRRKK
ncbi:MAG: hypothetical protein M9933_14820 [Chitinophagaceae bacterium]|nr:hypothetical protein [Chitinophagaceae bacterium]